MGIPLYFKKLSHEFVDIVSQSKPPEPVSRLFLDFNCAIHYCSNQIKKDTKSRYLNNDEFESLLIQACKDYIIKLKNVADPSDLVYVSIDGVVPMAKITQQRKRRFFSDFKNKDKTEWNSNAITPGTLFMKKLLYELNEFKKTIDFHMIVDAERGEGEHKICHHIRQNNVPNGLDIIYGLDADMILLSMLSKHSEKTYLLREHVKDDKILVYMNIANTKSQIYKQFVTIINNDTISSVDFIIQCYTFITFLLGNDFLPNLSYISLRSNGIESLLIGYKEVFDRLNSHILKSNSGKITLNYEFFKEYITVLSKDEDSMFRDQENKYYNTTQSHRMSNDTENYPITNKYPKIINSHKSGWRQNYYYHLFEKTSDSSIINMSCKLYIQGLKWIIMYYFNQDTEWNWFYRYNYSPTLMDLSNYILSNIDNVTVCHRIEEPSNKVKDIDQLVMVLPPSSTYLIPKKKYREIANNVSLGYAHHFPETFDICTFMRYKLHECGSQGLFLKDSIIVSNIIITE